jgi:hypothetical protein
MNNGFYLSRKAGLIASLAIHAKVNNWGSLFRKHLKNDIDYNKKRLLVL